MTHGQARQQWQSRSPAGEKCFSGLPTALFSSPYHGLKYFFGGYAACLVVARFVVTRSDMFSLF